MPIVAIVGAGLIGRSWAVVFARGGWTVRLTDPSANTLASAPRLIRQALDELAAWKLVEDAGQAAARVSVARSLTEAVAGVDLVQENGPETLEAKRSIFSALDAAAPRDAILASSTSAIVASKFTEDLAGRERCLVAHPVNPPHLVPVVELCGAPWTSPEAVAKARKAYESIGQAPITVNREIDGFVLNRLQVALLTEAFRLVGEGVVSPTDLDKTLADGLGLRWSFMGPFQTIELNAPGGIADYCARYAPFFRRYMADLPDAAVWDQANIDRVVAAWSRPPASEEIAARTAWRDRRLTALKAHKRSQSDI